jgi:hypothetical protein
LKNIKLFFKKLKFVFFKFLLYGVSKHLESFISLNTKKLNSFNSLSYHSNTGIKVELEYITLLPQNCLNILKPKSLLKKIKPIWFFFFKKKKSHREYFLNKKKNRNLSLFLLKECVELKKKITLLLKKEKRLKKLNILPHKN